MTLIPFDERDGYIWMDGEMLPWKEAKVHYLTHALHYATQVFEGERVYNGKIFKSREHSQRLINSGKMIYLDVPHTAEEICTIKEEVLKANNFLNGYVRAAAWRGPEQMGIDVGKTTTRMAVAVWDWGSYFDPKIRDTGIALTISKWCKQHPQSAPILAKTASVYNTNCMVKLEATRKGFADGLMLDYEGYVAEATGANFFAVKNGTLITPIPDRFLNGITRQTVIGLAKDAGIPVEERRIKPEELESFEEIFLTGSAAEVSAVGRIDDYTYTVGPITRQLRETYENLARGKTAPAAETESKKLINR